MRSSSLAFFAVVLSLAPARADDLAARAKRLHHAAIVVDTHVDAPDQLSDKYQDFAVRGATTHLDIPRMREGGLDAAFFSIYVASSHAESGTAAGRALELIDLTRRVVAEHPKDLVLVDSAAGIRKANRAGKLAVLMGLEGGHALEDSVGAMRELHPAGVRYVTLTHTNTNNWADSSGPFWLPDFDPKDSAKHGGLTDKGRAMVLAMNRAGMIVDISHVSDDTLADVLETSTAPVMASHSSCRALANMPRNLTDDQIRAIAAKGGVVMINFGSAFLDNEVYAKLEQQREALKPEYLALKQRYAKDPAALRKALKEMGDRQETPRTQWTRIVDHIDHVIEVGGPDAVGLGSDFDGVEDLPIGMEDASMLPKITEELLRRGHSEQQVKKVLGENFLAFFARVEAAAKKP